MAAGFGLVGGMWHGWEGSGIGIGNRLKKSAEEVESSSISQVNTSSTATGKRDKSIINLACHCHSSHKFIYLFYINNLEIIPKYRYYIQSQTFYINAF
jgi:hypothetical protein